MIAILISQSTLVQAYRSVPLRPCRQEHGGDTEQRLRAAQQCLEMLSRAMEDIGLNVLAEAAGPETPRLVNVSHDASLHVMIAAIAPSEFSLEETVSTLRFAERVKKIRTMARKNAVRQEHGGDTE